MNVRDAIHAPQRPVTEVLDRLKEVLPAVLDPYPVDVAYLYGSMARGRATPFSDIDLALVLDRPFPPYERLMLELEIQAAVEEASGLRGVEVRAVDAAPLQVRGRVLQEGIRLYERDRTRRVAFEAQTWKQYLDFA
ncbi:MAG: type VII toxin-antitoxin system MntA family adenylyltransferase antitoxin, partial [Chloroflexia bacterium]